MDNNLLINSPQIYAKLQDDISRNIYKYRTLYNFTGDTEYIRKVVKFAPFGRKFLEEISRAIKKGNKICIFGAGAWGRVIHKYYTNVNFCCFIDNNEKKWGKIIEGLPVISLNEWQKVFGDTTIIIASKFFHREIHAQLLVQGIPKKNIINIGPCIEGNGLAQYFDLEEFDREKEEIFLDGGAFDGQSSEMFLKWAENGKNKVKCKILAFEPDTSNRKKCEDKFGKINYEYKIFPVGLWNAKNTLRFAATANLSSHIVQSDKQQEEAIGIINVDKIDNLIEEKVTFLKMDIEGAELEALRGAENTIKTYKPKLAICVYHKPEDLYAIPELILNFVPEYRFWLRHYSLYESETVLFGIC